MSNVDSMAVLKRSVFLIISKDAIYWRLPGALPTQVPCRTWMAADILKDSCKPILSNYKLDGPLPPTQNSRQDWETAWLQEAIRQHDHPGSHGPGPVRIKQERIAFAQSLVRASPSWPYRSGLTIPPPQRACSHVRECPFSGPEP